LPKRPEDTFTPTSLNSEAEEQANVEQKEDSVSEPDSKQPKPSTSELKPARSLPKDRYIAPEMANWTKVFRFQDMMLVPTFVNDSPSMLFGFDTGLFADILSLREARQLGKVNSQHLFGLKGLNGKVNKVYSAKATLRFAHLQQPSRKVDTLDLSLFSRSLGTEISGFLGFDTLRLLEIKLDYRDGLVDFEYDPKPISVFTK
jgi:hypothetical protein